MDIDYHQLTSELDAREVLRYLNNLGIHNISGEVLKYFITDLKKLIKHDLDSKHKGSDFHEPFEIHVSERLHSASTFSSRIRSRASDGAVVKCSRECQHIRKVLNIRNAHSAPNFQTQVPNNKPLRRACSCVRVENPETAKTRVTASSNNLIKVPIQPVKKKCDPVSLYHYYTSLWAKYKPNVPGENNWSELRWNVRQKMAGNITKQVGNKMSDIQSRVKLGKQTKN